MWKVVFHNSILISARKIRFTIKKTAALPQQSMLATACMGVEMADPMKYGAVGKKLLKEDTQQATVRCSCLSYLPWAKIKIMMIRKPTTVKMELQEGCIQLCSKFGISSTFLEYN